MENEFKALVVRETEDGFSQSIENKKISELPEGDVLIQVKYSGLNYKDALSSFGHKGITRNYPHTPGVDAAGVVLEDKSGTFESGDKVICTSFEFGNEHIRRTGVYDPCAWHIGWCHYLKE